MKARINRNNYEEFFIDYLDGNLDESTIIELENFLLHNPDLREELEGMEDVFVSPTKSGFHGKENLKQIDLGIPVTESNFEFFCIAELEGDLNEGEQQALTTYLKENPEKQKDRELFRSLRLKKDENINFKNKGSLKRSIFILYRREIITGISIAAGIAILLGLFFGIVDRNIQSPSYNLAESEEKTAVDSTASKKDPVEVQKENQEEGKVKKLLKKPVIKNAKANLSFKVNIPIASNEIEKEAKSDTQSFKTEEDSIDIDKFRNININPERLNNAIAYSTVKTDRIEIKSFYSTYTGLNFTEPQQYLSLEQYAKKKFSEFVFGNDETKINALNLASAGINKINQLTGSSMKLESEEVEEGSGKKVAFNSNLISFSTVIARED